MTFYALRITPEAAMTKKLSFVFLVLALLLAACGAQETPAAPVTAPAPDSGVIAEGRLVPAQNLLVFPQARGTVTEILVERRPGRFQKAMSCWRRPTAPKRAGRRPAGTDPGPRASMTSSRRRVERRRCPGRNTSRRKSAALPRKKSGKRSNRPMCRTKLTRPKPMCATARRNWKTPREFDKYKDLKTDNPTRRGAEDELRIAEANYNEAIRKVEELRRKVDAPKEKPRWKRRWPPKPKPNAGSRTP